MKVAIPGELLSDHELFTEGSCHILANEIRRLTGWPVCAFWVCGEYDVHAFVKTPDGRYLDIDGISTEEEMADRWSQEAGDKCEIREIVPWDTLGEGDHDDWSWRIDLDYSKGRAKEIAPDLILAHTGLEPIV